MENYVNMPCLQNMDKKRTQKVHVHKKYVLEKIIIILYTGMVLTLHCPKMPLYVSPTHMMAAHCSTSKSTLSSKRYYFKIKTVLL